ncbi:MAG: 3-isopropylmalate dehydratase small subunit [Verrucomicrobiota bacterium]|jgi:3-isopropylmalate/(R)-2-methylmalate dehydratase small subunit
MEAFTTHRGIVATLDRANVDTDQIIPKQFLKSIKRTGFGPSLFFDWRYDDHADPDPDFELNAPRFEGKSILITRNNFGCGSSREHAVWALAQDGYRVVVAPAQGKGDARTPGFADIFRNNCGKNGLLTIELNEAEVEEIFQLVAANEGLEASVDLPAQTITFLADENRVYRYAFDAAVKESMVKGLDDIAQTLEHAPDVAAFELTHDALIDLPD